MDTSKILVEKKARLWLYCVFCKIMDNYPVFCYVKEKSCNKTHFELLIQFDRFFPDFFLCCLYYAKATILNLLCFREELEVKEKPERLLHG